MTNVDGFLLKSRSPSCGTRDVKLYAGNHKAPVSGKGSGLFGKEVLHMFGHLAVEEEGRLKNFTIREHFFTKLFTLAEFKSLKQRKSMKHLVQFHTDHKYVFMAYNQRKLKEMGRIIANHEKRIIVDVLDAYENALSELFQRTARYTAHINVCQHIFGHFKDYLKREEKEHFLSLLQRYAEKKIPLSSILTVLRSWVIRFEEEYLLRQTYFEPYPEALMEITDSGKGRDY